MVKTGAIASAALVKRAEETEKTPPVSSATGIAGFNGSRQANPTKQLTGVVQWLQSRRQHRQPENSH